PPPTPTSLLALHDALPISAPPPAGACAAAASPAPLAARWRPPAKHRSLACCWCWECSHSGCAPARSAPPLIGDGPDPALAFPPRSEEHTSELQSRVDVVCR